MANLLGTSGDDKIIGTAGNDLIKGLGGDDSLRGGLGADRLDGGSGNDRATYVDSAKGVYVSLESGLGYGGTAEGDTLVNIEGLRGSDHADTLLGNYGDNFLFGGLGQDHLAGLDGDDLLWGDQPDPDAGGDDDVLKGGGGADQLYGGSGNDHLIDGPGRDGLCGGTYTDASDGQTGADTFAWWSASDTGTSEETADLVYDFGFLEGDRIDLQQVDANVYAAGNQMFTFIGTAAFSGTPGEIRYYHSEGNTYIEMQTGTSVDVEGVIRLVGLHTPEASWFVL